MCARSRMGWTEKKQRLKGFRVEWSQEQGPRQNWHDFGRPLLQERMRWLTPAAMQCVRVTSIHPGRVQRMQSTHAWRHHAWAMLSPGQCPFQPKLIGNYRHNSLPSG